MEGKIIFEWRTSRVEPKNSGIVRRDKRDCKRNLKIIMPD